MPKREGGFPSSQHCEADKRFSSGTHPRSQLFDSLAAPYGPGQGANVGEGEATALAKRAMWTVSQEAPPEAGTLPAPASAWSYQPVCAGLSADLIQHGMARSLPTQRKLRRGGDVQGSLGELLGEILSPF